MYTKRQLPEMELERCRYCKESLPAHTPEGDCLFLPGSKYWGQAQIQNPYGLLTEEEIANLAREAQQWDVGAKKTSG